MYSLIYLDLECSSIKYEVEIRVNVTHVVNNIVITFSVNDQT